MNNNKQLNKGDKMRKIAMIVSVLAVLGTSAQAGYWVATPNFGTPYGGSSTTWSYSYQPSWSW